MVALRLGLTSFGGPVAHLGYFERAYVQQRQWLSSEEYGSLVALCQALPGPASSQVGFLIGLHRAGWLGAFAAWLGFTLPSALLLYGGAVISVQAQGPLAKAGLHAFETGSGGRRCAGGLEHGAEALSRSGDYDTGAVGSFATADHRR